MARRVATLMDLARTPIGSDLVGGVVTDDGWIELDPGTALPPAIGAPSEYGGPPLGRAFSVCSSRTAALESWAEACTSLIVDDRIPTPMRFRGVCYVRFTHMPCVCLPDGWSVREFIEGRKRDQRLSWLIAQYETYGVAAVVGPRGRHGTSLLVLEEVREDYVVVGNMHVYEHVTAETESDLRG